MSLLRRLAPSARPPDWSALASGRPAARAALVLATLAALLVLLLAVHVYVSPSATEDRSGEPVSDAPKRKLLVLVVDALNPEVVDSGRLRFLRPLLDTGFRAEVEPCIDRLTIPCLRDAFTGVSSFGLFGAFDNLVAAREVHASNLFRDLAETGRRAVGVSHGELDQFGPWLELHYTGKDELQAVGAAVRAGVDLVVYHYVWLDLVTHRAAFGSPPYDEAMEALDAVGSQLLDGLPPSYDFAVVGDHGHDEVGRHIQGLDVPTVFLSNSTALRSGGPDDRIPITTYRYLFGASLGLLPPPQYEGIDLEPWLVEGPLKEAAAGRTYTRRSLARGRLWMPLAAALLLPALAWWGVPGGRRGRWLAGAVAAAAFASGALYPTVIRVLHFNLSLPDVSHYLPLTLLLIGIVWLVVRRSYRFGACLLALAALCLPPTVYRYGLLLRAIELSLAAILLLLFLPAVNRAIRERRWIRLAGTVGLLAAAWIATGALAPIMVMNFMVLGFPGLHLPPAATILMWLGWGALTAAMSVSWRRGLPVGALATLGASGPIGLAGGLPPAAVAGLTALCLVALVSPATMPLLLVGAWLSPAWYTRPEAIGILLTAVMLLTARALPAPKGDRRTWTLAALTAGLSYYGLALSTGLRANGIDYQFALAWLPGRLAERFWWVIALAVAAKALLPAGLLTHPALPRRRSHTRTAPAGGAGPPGDSQSVPRRFSHDSRTATALPAVGDL